VLLIVLLVLAGIAFVAAAARVALRVELIGLGLFLWVLVDLIPRLAALA